MINSVKAEEFKNITYTPSMIFKFLINFNQVVEICLSGDTSGEINGFSPANAIRGAYV